ncbi:hypothetical protein [Lacinutrix mariniflava]|uniref:hypothetical protein n=1 Tax=Lacinutrix mariniflava TaxID=342955 RepID=UPI000A4AC11F|nr:hypothetical protein [Lacinutrix mariniflava]
MKLAFKYLYIVILLISSCKEEKQQTVEEVERPIITDKFKLEFLNDILSNKEDEYLYPYDYKKPYLMFNSIEYKGNKDVAYIAALGKPSTLPEYVNHFFKENDTVYIINQIKDNYNLNVFQLSKYGHNIIDWSKVRYTDKNSKEVRLISEDSIQKLITDNEKEGQLMLSKPIFNKKLNKAYVSVGYFMSHGYDLLYVKENSNWKFVKILNQYVN